MPLSRKLCMKGVGDQPACSFDPGCSNEAGITTGWCQLSLLPGFVEATVPIFVVGAETVGARSAGLRSYAIGCLCEERLQENLSWRQLEKNNNLTMHKCHSSFCARGSSALVTRLGGRHMLQELQELEILIRAAEIPLPKLQRSEYLGPGSSILDFFVHSSHLTILNSRHHPRSYHSYLQSFNISLPRCLAKIITLIPTPTGKMFLTSPKFLSGWPSSASSSWYVIVSRSPQQDDAHNS
jgi:hypothetical protein